MTRSFFALLLLALSACGGEVAIGTVKDPPPNDPPKNTPEDPGSTTPTPPSAPACTAALAPGVLYDYTERGRMRVWTPDETRVLVGRDDAGSGTPFQEIVSSPTPVTTVLDLSPLRKSFTWLSAIAVGKDGALFYALFREKTAELKMLDRATKLEQTVTPPTSIGELYAHRGRSDVYFTSGDAVWGWAPPAAPQVEFQGGTGANPHVAVTAKGAIASLQEPTKTTLVRKGSNGAVEAFATLDGTATVVDLAADETTAFVAVASAAEKLSIYRVPLDATPRALGATDIIADLPEKLPTRADLAVTGSSLYAAVAQPCEPLNECPQPTRVMRISKTPAAVAPSVVKTYPSGGRIQSDGCYLYGSDYASIERLAD